MNEIIIVCFFRNCNVQCCQCLLIARADPNSATNYGDTPLSLAHSKELIQLLVKYGATPSDMCKAFEDFLPRNCPQTPEEPAMNVITVGKTGVGKSTLIEALKWTAKGVSGISSLVGQVISVSAEKKTAGIKPYTIRHASIGKLQVYDLAGHKEFYSSHDAIISRSLSGSPSAVLLVVNLKSSSTDIKKTLLYWLNFLKAKLPPSQSLLPHLICIGSHLDQAHNMPERKVVIENFIKKANSSGFVASDFIVMNCKFAVSEGMTKLQQMLSKCFQSFPLEKSMSFHAHCFHVFLVSKGNTNPAIQLKAVLEESTACNKSDGGVLSFLPTRLEDLVLLCDQLSRQNLILFFRSTEALEESWIIIDHKAILSKLHGIIFASEGFKTYCNFSSSTGVVPLSNLTAKFKKLDLDSSMITQYLTHLQYCTELNDRTLKLLKPSAEFNFSERYFFFPHHITEKRPDNVWEPDKKYVHHCGWEIECSNPEHFFVPHFLHLILLRIAFLHALKDTHISDDIAIHRLCNIWKNGIYWNSADLVSGLVEVADDAKKVTILVRSQNQDMMNALSLLTTLVREVLDTKEEACHTVDINEHFLPSDVANSYPLKHAAHTKWAIHGSCLINAIARREPGVMNVSTEFVSLDDTFPITRHNSMVMNQRMCEDDPEHRSPIPQDSLSFLSKNIKSNIFFVATSRTGKQLPSLVQQKLYQKIEEWREKGCSVQYSDLQHIIHQYGVFSLLVSNSL